ncbi:WXG100 family type VII secretion target [Saccharopolyspora elongata]|uniref:WXG100 family type VII secretion target n=1 Tax=Saccharopolyspora elongata TaxID=2530387 RepID=UPI001405587B|nr:WXG100 family type VII secretion target [Saccharopolyspora elongata]
MDDEIQYQYAALRAGVDKMRGATKALSQKIDDLKNQTGNLLQSWDAQASQTYQTKAGNISAAFTAMNETLNGVTSAVDTGQDNMRQIDGKLASSFD